MWTPLDKAYCMHGRGGMSVRVWHMYMNVCEHECTCTCMWRAEVNVRCLPHLLSTFLLFHLFIVCVRTRMRAWACSRAQAWGWVLSFHRMSPRIKLQSLGPGHKLYLIRHLTALPYLWDSISHWTWSSSRCTLAAQPIVSKDEALIPAPPYFHTQCWSPICLPPSPAFSWKPEIQTQFPRLHIIKLSLLSAQPLYPSLWARL